MKRKLPDFRAEIQSHIALEAERLTQEGMNEAEAWDAARRRFGNITATEERFYERTSQPWLEHLAQDLRYAARLLGRSPGFALAAVLTLALGIGANTAIFTAIDALALHPMPFGDPSRLMAIETRKTSQPEVEAWSSKLDLDDLRKNSQSFESMAGISPVWNLVMTGHDAAERFEGLYVSADFFPMLGIDAAAGRRIQREDDRSGSPGVVMLSHELWMRRFGGDRALLGRPLTLDGGTFTVIGILPKGFAYPGEPVAGKSSVVDLWLPLSANMLTNGSPRGLRYLKIIGSLKPGVTSRQASDEVQRIGASLAARYADTNRDFAMSARSLEDSIASDIRPMSLLLLGAVGLVLAMACASVANLLLVRASARHREIFMRVALGASRKRLTLQLLMEGLLLALLGGLAGVALAAGGLQALVAAAPASLVGHRTIAIDWRALSFTAGLVLLSAIVASLPPALKLLNPNIGAGLRRVSHSMAGGSHRFRAALVASQIAFALMLLIGAGLLLRSFARLLDVSPGFDTNHLVSIATQLPRSAATPEQRTALYRVIEQRLREAPGVESVAAVSRLPLSGMSLGSWLWMEGRMHPGDPHPDVEYRVATSNYFATMKIPLASGRLYDERGGDNALLCVINETLARSYYPGVDPVGRRVKFGANVDNAPWVTIVGVVGDVRHFGIEAMPHPEVYRPYARNPLTAPNLVIRVKGDPAPLLAPLAAAVRGVNPEMPAYNVMSMRELARRSTAQRRFVMDLLLLFAAAAMILAAVGIYGAASQLVTQRTREIGLRMALGATPAAALAMVLRMGAALAAAGILAGAVASMGLSKWIRGVLYQVSPLDPLVFGAAATVLGFVAIAACWGPARRATRVAPMAALREE